MEDQRRRRCAEVGEAAFLGSMGLTRALFVRTLAASAVIPDPGTAATDGDVGPVTCGKRRGGWRGVTGRPGGGCTRARGHEGTVQWEEGAHSHTAGVSGGMYLALRPSHCTRRLQPFEPGPDRLTGSLTGPQHSPTTANLAFIGTGSSRTQRPPSRVAIHSFHRHPLPPLVPARAPWTTRWPRGSGAHRDAHGGRCYCHAAWRSPRF